MPARDGERAREPADAEPSREEQNRAGRRENEPRAQQELPDLSHRVHRSRKRSGPAGAGLSVDRIRAADGTALALHRLGPAGGRPALLVPGAFSDHRFWLGTRGTGFGRELADRGFAVTVLDPRGHGGSDRPPRGSRWRFRDWIEQDVPAALRATAGSGSVVLVGHSAGGAAVLAAAGASSEVRGRVTAIAALATPTPRGGPWRRSAAAFAAALSWSLGRFPARFLGLGGEDELGGVMVQWMSWNVAGAWRWRGGPDLLAALAPVPFPVLVAAGSGDRLFAPRSGCRALCARLGENARFAEFGRATGCSEDFGHAGLVVSRAARTEVWPVILDWIESAAG